MSYENFEKKINELGDLGDRMMQGLPYGQGGAVTGASSFDTFSSPDVSQNPDKFGSLVDKSKLSANSKQSMNIISPFSPENEESPEDYEKDVDAVKYTVTPDEVLCGIDYEMKKMVLKDKQVAKQNVVNNLKHDPQYYSKLKMLDIVDEEPEQSEKSEKPDNQPVNNELDEFYTPQEKEIRGIMREMYKKRYNR